MYELISIVAKAAKAANIAANIVSIRAGMGKLSSKKADPRLERVFLYPTKDKSEHMICAIVANHGEKEASNCKCYVKDADGKCLALDLPEAEILKEEPFRHFAAIASKKEFNLAGGAVKEVRGYFKWDKDVIVVLEHKAIEVDTRIELPRPKTTESLLK